MNEGKKLTFYDHIKELRRRVFISAIALAVTTALSFAFTERIFLALLRPAEGIKPVFTEMTEMLSTYFQVAILSGFILALPVVVYQLILFIAPALTPKEKRYLYFILPGVSISFVIGVLFGYFVLLPPALMFFLTFGTEIATPYIRIGNYINLVTRLLFWIGLAFETPFIMFILARIGILPPRVLTKYRRFAFLGAFVLGAVITPTFDPINQSLVAVSLIALYEVGILAARLAWRRK